MKDKNVKYTVTTSIESAHAIEQKAVQDTRLDDGLSRTLFRQVVDLQNQEFRNALIHLGWKPPKGA